MRSTQASSRAKTPRLLTAPFRNSVRRQPTPAPANPWGHHAQPPFRTGPSAQRRPPEQIRRGRVAAFELCQRLLAAGFSRYEPDPIGAFIAPHEARVATRSSKSRTGCKLHFVVANYNLAIIILQTMVVVNRIAALGTLGSFPRCNSRQSKREEQK
jgi:hypothetical protein